MKARIKAHIAMLFVVVLLITTSVSVVGLTTKRVWPNAINVNTLTRVEMLDATMQSVVAIYHPNMGIPASGFYIGNGIIVTAGHVAKKDGLERVVFEDGDTYNILRQIVHPDFDCGFLLISKANSVPNTFPYPDEPVLKFDSTEIRRGETVFILGNPNDLVFNVSKGVVSSTNRLCDGYFGEAVLMGYDAVAVGGSSGAVVIDKDGEIRGVHVGDKRFHGSAVAITASDILEAMKVAGL